MKQITQEWMNKAKDDDVARIPATEFETKNHN